MGMIPATDNVTIYQGSTFTRTWSVTSGLTLGDYDSARLQIRTIPESNNKVYDSTNGGLTLGASSITLAISAEDTAKYDFKEAYYDLEIVQDGSPNVVDKLIRGKITLITENTK